VTRSAGAGRPHCRPHRALADFELDSLILVKRAKTAWPDPVKWSTANESRSLVDTGGSVAGRRLIPQR